MPLTIEGATVGYDRSGIQQLINDVRANVIESAQEKMKSSLDTLNTSIDDIWVGHSADLFKQNMATDVEAIRNALQTTYEIFSSEVAQISQAMGQVDQALIEKR